MRRRRRGGPYWGSKATSRVAPDPPADGDRLGTGMANLQETIGLQWLEGDAEELLRVEGPSQARISVMRGSLGPMSGSCARDLARRGLAALFGQEREREPRKTRLRSSPVKRALIPGAMKGTAGGAADERSSSGPCATGSTGIDPGSLALEPTPAA